MAMLLIPMHYYNTGYKGSAAKLNSSMAGELTGYEIYKGFSSDTKEYLKVTGNIDITYPYVNGGVQAVAVISDNLLSSTTNKLYLYKAALPDYSNAIIKTPAIKYGDGITSDTYFSTLFPVDRQTKSIAVYSNDTAYNYYRISITPASQQKIQMLMHGVLNTLPDGYRLSERDYSYKYNYSSVKINLVGNVYYDGLQNNGVKRTHTLSYEYLSEVDMLNLLDYFKLGKGGLPMYFVDDENNPDSWMLCGITSMNVTEKYAGYFNATLNIFEY
jgi:hypothetical protein